jgi:MarR family transcriptional regulator, organic hydroperoxide resistance regulator
MRLLWALVHSLDKTSKRMQVRLGVTGPQRLVLRVVGLFPGLSAGQLATILHVHPSTLTGVLSRLANQHLLSRTADVADRRRAVLHLTRRGARVNRATSGTVEAAVGRALRQMSRRDRAVARRVLAVMAVHLDAPVAANAPGAPERRPPPKSDPGGFRLADRPSTPVRR